MEKEKARDLFSSLLLKRRNTMSRKTITYKLAIVNSQYCDYLREYDSRVSYNANEYDPDFRE